MLHNIIFYRGIDLKDKRQIKNSTLKATQPQHQPSQGGKTDYLGWCSKRRRPLQPSQARTQRKHTKHEPGLWPPQRPNGRPNLLNRPTSSPLRRAIHASLELSWPRILLANSGPTLPTADRRSRVRRRVPEQQTWSYLLLTLHH